MKEEAPTKKLPPKMSISGSGGGTPTKTTTCNDEILSNLLRINNFDSISSIKDESLDIDLTACVTISADQSGIITGNSLSCTDFWRVLDESAQNSQLDIGIAGDETLTLIEGGGSDLSRATPTPSSKAVKTEANCFSGTFLRPEPPSHHAVSFSSPLKKLAKALPAEHPQQQQQQRRIKVSLLDSKKLKETLAIKEEPPEQLLADSNEMITMDNSNGLNAIQISPSRFNMFAEMPAHAASDSCNGAAKASPDCADNAVPTTTTNAAALPSVPLYKCLDCAGVLRGQEEYAAHHALAHRILYMCDVCERNFEQEAGLKKHLKTHRPLEPRKDAWKKCPDCGKCLKMGSMWMHRKIHTENKKYGCDICGQKFVQKINLTHHSRVHTAEKPYECPECHKRFQERSHLQRHQKYHAQTRSYRCEKCGKMYKTERCLKVHNLVHLEQRPFACNVCDKSFISNSKLKQHSNIHTGERPFKCNYCPRDFTNFPNWLKHTRRRHKVDHKTGEHLENIPSYCSKKSAKTAKPPKVIEPPTEAMATPGTGNGAVPAKAVPVKPQAKRKKKLTPATNGTTGAAEKPLAPVVRQAAKLKAADATNPATAAGGGNEDESLKAPKSKRERKQLTPKQVQRAPMIAIKKEQAQPITRNPSPTGGGGGGGSGGANKPRVFPDLHCLSITSAEELIMEQALEMEECGLYDTPVSGVNTDNAISSETAAALQFKIKNEFSVDNIKEEEFLSVNDSNNRVLCSSLESSPYSSPASNELTSITVPVPSRLAAELQVPTTFYLPSFALNSQGTIVTSMCSPMSSQANASGRDAGPPTLVQLKAAPGSAQSQQPQQHQQQQHQLQTQALLNQLYLPMSMGMPLIVQPNQQMLPSVDTILFSANGSAQNGTYFHHGKAVAQHLPSAHQNLS